MKSFWQVFKEHFKEYMKPDLWWAARGGNVQQIEQLVAEGHDVNSHNSKMDDENSTPLHVAARYGKTEAIRALVRLGARIDEKNREGTTPLIEAVNGTGREEVVQLLVELGASLDARDKLLKTALEWAASAGKAELVELLLKGGAKPNPGRGDKRSSPVYYSIDGGNIRVLELLVAAKADVNAPSSDMSPLSCAALDGRADFVKALLDAGAETSPRGSNGSTPLMSAVAGGSLEIVQALVKAGVDLNAVRRDTRETALDIAEDRKHRKIADYLRGIGARHANDLSQPAEAEDSSASSVDWQLRHDAIFVATIEPWPPREGVACVKVEVTTADEFTRIVESVACRVAKEELNSEAWRPMRETEEDEEGSIHFELPINLAKNSSHIQFRVVDRLDPEPQELNWTVGIQ